LQGEITSSNPTGSASTTETPVISDPGVFAFRPPAQVIRKQDQIG